MSSIDEGIEVPPLSRRAIRQAAERARKVLNIPDGRINCEQVLERLVLYGISLDVFDDGDSPVPPDVEAFFDPPPSSTLFIRLRVYNEMRRGGQRAAFTLGHELGHIVLAHRRTLNRASTPGSFPAYRNSEWQANMFAAEFTMPLNVINEYGLHGQYALAGFFGVSPHAASVRLENLRKYGELKEKPSDAPTSEDF